MGAETAKHICGRVPCVSPIVTEICAVEFASTAIVTVFSAMKNMIIPLNSLLCRGS
jgi:hypothetical protein